MTFKKPNKESSNDKYTKFDDTEGVYEEYKQWHKQMIIKYTNSKTSSAI